MKFWQKVAASAVSLAVVGGLVAVQPLSVAAAAAPQQQSAFPHMDHVFVFMMENHSARQILDPTNTNTPFIQSLAKTYGLAKDYYGVTHVSLPNYIASISGSNWGSNSDDPAQKTLLDHTNLVDQLEANHVSWKGYMQSLPYPGDTADFASYTATPNSPGNALYVLKHDPFLLFPDVYQNPSRAKNVVPLHQLASDLASNRVPQFAWISPNVCYDMHGMSGTACPYSNDAQLQKNGDNFLKQWVPAIMKSRAWTGNSAIFITWDEGTSNAGCCDAPLVANPQVNTSTGSGGDLTTATVYGGGHVPMIVIARNGVRGFSNDQPYNHYSLLRTIEENWHLGYLAHAADARQVHSLKAFLVPSSR